MELESNMTSVRVVYRFIQAHPGLSAPALRALGCETGHVLVDLDRLGLIVWRDGWFPVADSVE